MKTLNWTLSNLELLPDDEGKRYEIIEGELYVSNSITTFARIWLSGKRTFQLAPLKKRVCKIRPENSAFVDRLWYTQRTL